MKSPGDPPSGCAPRHRARRAGRAGCGRAARRVRQRHQVVPLSPYHQRWRGDLRQQRADVVAEDVPDGRAPRCAGLPAARPARRWAGSGGLPSGQSGPTSTAKRSALRGVSGRGIPAASTSTRRCSRSGWRAGQVDGDLPAHGVPHQVRGRAHRQLPSTRPAGPLCRPWRESPRARERPNPTSSGSSTRTRLASAGTLRCHQRAEPEGRAAARSARRPPELQGVDLEGGTASSERRGSPSQLAGSSAAGRSRSDGDEWAIIAGKRSAAGMVAPRLQAPRSLARGRAGASDSGTTVVIFVQLLTNYNI